MTYSVYFTEEANADIDKISDYIAQDSPETALKFIDQLEQRITDTLSIAPHGGRQFAEARYLAFDNYIVVYDVDDAEKRAYIHLVTERHRQWQSLFSDR